jgi:hypothetical protein
MTGMVPMYAAGSQIVPLWWHEIFRSIPPTTLMTPKWKAIMPDTTYVIGNPSTCSITAMIWRHGDLFWDTFTRRNLRRYDQKMSEYSSRIYSKRIWLPPKSLMVQSFTQDGSSVVSIKRICFHISTFWGESSVSPSNLDGFCDISENACILRPLLDKLQWATVTACLKMDKQSICWCLQLRWLLG